MDVSQFDPTDLISKASEMVLIYAPKLLLAIVTLIIGLWIIKLITRAIAYVLEARQFDPSLQKWLASILGVLLKACLFISVISMIGVQTTSFIAILGAAGLAVGLALQGSLSNFAGGVLILIFKPFKVGDYIQAQGQEGVVDAIDVFCTFLTTLDNQQVILPNGPLAGDKLVNLTHQPKRRVDLSVGISYGDNIDKAQQALIAMAKKDPRILSEHEPFVGVSEYGDNSINLVFWVWCKTDDYWDVFFDTNKKIKAALDGAGISIPFPQRDVHIVSGQMG